MLNDIKTITELNIYKNAEFAGVLKRTPQGCEFQLCADFLANTSMPYFSYCIKNSTHPLMMNGDNLPPFFAGLLPEGRRLNALVNKLKTSADDLFSLFAAVGADCIGDIDTGNPAPVFRKDIPALKHVNFYDFFNETMDPESSLIDTNALAGVQEKISASMISFPLNIAKKDKAYILKLNPIDKPNLIQNEFHCLALAKKCGFNVGKAKILHDKDHHPGLLVERFDRTPTRKLHQEDACQFLNRYPADKYRLNMQEIADRFIELTTAPQIEILNLLRQYVFSYLIGNGDMHAKNISLQTLEDGTITLTPLYDLICTALYGDFHMALKMDGRDANIQRKTIIAFAERYKINTKAMNSALDQLLEQFSKHYRNLFLIDMTEKKKTSLNAFFLRRIDDFKS
jgi:serine/threonine-protein kinase HipA